MFSKLVKYEFRKGIVPYTIILITMIVAFFILAFQGMYFKNNLDSFNSSNNGVVVMVMGTFMLTAMTYLLIIVGGVFNFIQGVMYMADEVFRSKGYLTFSTPNSGNKILFSKLFTYFLRIFIYDFIILIFGFILGVLIFNDSYEMNLFFRNIFANPILIFLFFLMVLLSPMIHMAFIYFIMILNVTVFDFKHKILSSFLMYFIITIILRVISFIFQIIFQISAENFVASDSLIAFYKFISIKVPISIIDYTGSSVTNTVPLPIIPVFMIGFGILFLLYFITCRLINKGINI